MHTEASLGWGGQEIRIINESRGMRSRGHRIIIASPRDSAINKRARKEGFTVYDIDFIKKNPMSFRRVRSVIQNEGVDILNTHSSRDSWVSSTAALLARQKPFIIRTRHLSTPISGSFLSRFIYESMADAIITTGEVIKRQMVRDNGFNGDKIFPIPTGVDLKAFDPDRTAPSIKKDGFAVGMVSVLRSWKGHEYFIKAVPEIIRNIPGALFFIAGDGPYLGKINSLLDQFSLRDRITMLGHREDVAGVIKSLDVIVHPSYANEGVPQSILQSMAMKTPVVASDAGAIKEVVIDGETGFLTEPGDPSRIAEKVIELYRDPGLGRTFCENARRLVEENFSTEKMLDKIEDIYRGFSRAIN